MSSLDRTQSSVSALADAWRDAWIAAAPEAFGACCGVGVTYEDPLATEPREGLAALARHAALLRKALPDMRVEAAGRPLAEAGFGCLPWRVVGTHRGEVAGVPASGRFLSLQGLHYVELVDGRIARARGFFDLYDAAVQLGLLPARGSLGETALLMLRGYGLRPRG